MDLKKKPLKQEGWDKGENDDVGRRREGDDQERKIQEVRETEGGKKSTVIRSETEKKNKKAKLGNFG